MEREWAYFVTEWRWTWWNLFLCLFKTLFDLTPFGSQSFLSLFLCALTLHFCFIFFRILYLTEMQLLVAPFGRRGFSRFRRVPSRRLSARLLRGRIEFGARQSVSLRIILNECFAQVKGQDPVLTSAAQDHERECEFEKEILFHLFSVPLK